MPTITVETYSEQESYWRERCAIQRFINADIAGDSRAMYRFWFAELRQNQAHETLYAVGKLCREIKRADLYVLVSRSYWQAYRSFTWRQLA